MNGPNRTHQEARGEASLPLLAEMQRIQDEAHTLSEETSHRLDELFGHESHGDGRSSDSGRG